MTDRFRIAFITALLLGATALSLQGCGQKPTAAKPDNIVIAVDRNGTVTYTYDGKNVTCAQLEPFFRKMAKGSKGKIKPFPCHELDSQKS